MKRISICLVLAMMLAFSIPTYVYADDVYISTDDPRFDQIIEKFIAVNYAVSSELDSITDSVIDALKSSYDAVGSAIRLVVSPTLQGVISTYNLASDAVSFIKDSIDNYIAENGAGVSSPEGFVPLLSVPVWSNGANSSLKQKFDCNSTNFYATKIKADTVVVCSFDSLNNKNFYVRIINSSTSAVIQTMSSFAYGNYFYWNMTNSNVLKNANIPVAYSSVNSAISAFYGFVPTPTIEVIQNPNIDTNITPVGLGSDWSSVNSNIYNNITEGDNITNVFNTYNNYYNSPSDNLPVYNPTDIYNSVNTQLDNYSNGLFGLPFSVDTLGMGFLTSTYYALPSSLQNLILLTLLLALASVVTGVGSLVAHKLR